MQTFSDKLSAAPALGALLRTRRRADVLALLSGALLPLAFAPFAIWPLAIFCITLLLWSWQWQTPRRAAWRGGLFGLGAYTVGIYWVYISLHDYGNAPAPFAILVTLALILVMALYPALLGYALTRWAPRLTVTKYLLVAPAAWALLEWVRSWLFSGFPWLALGYSQIDSSLAGLAPYAGVFGVSWAVVLSAGLLLLLLTAGKWRPRLVWIGLMGLLWIAAWGLGKITWVEPVGAPVRVSLVQGNLSQDQKWLPQQLQRTLERYAGLSAAVAQDSDLIIWPETAIPVFYHEAQGFVRALQAQAERSAVDYLVGVPSGSREMGIFHNSMVALGTTRGFYHKRRLVPFGEYVPFRGLLNVFHQFVDIPMADFTSGARDQPLLQVAGHPVGISICFEVVFGTEIRTALPHARFLVNVSNDAWFGDSLAPHQHLQIARMRALEMGRYMARATNTGITAVIDPRGNIVARSRPFSVQVLQSQVQPLQGTTPYARMGDKLPVFLLGGILIIGLILTRTSPPTL